MKTVDRHSDVINMQMYVTIYNKYQFEEGNKIECDKIETGVNFALLIKREKQTKKNMIKL